MNKIYRLIWYLIKFHLDQIEFHFYLIHLHHDYIQLHYDEIHLHRNQFQFHYLQLNCIVTILIFKFNFSNVYDILATICANIALVFKCH